MYLKSQISISIAAGLALLASSIAFPPSISMAQVSTSNSEPPLTLEEVNSSPPPTPGLRPGIPGPDGSIPTVERVDKPNQTLDVPSSSESLPTLGGNSSKQALLSTARTCRGYVCIQLYYSGGIVYYWKTTAHYPRYICTYAAYWLNGRLVATSRWGCGNRFVSSLRTRIRARGKTFCNSWYNIPGAPCLRFPRS